MKPQIMKWDCPICRQKLNIPADMEDQTFKCPCCGTYHHYVFRTRKFEQTERPERNSASGLRVY